MLYSFYEHGWKQSHWLYNVAIGLDTFAAIEYVIEDPNHKRYYVDEWVECAMWNLVQQLMKWKRCIWSTDELDYLIEKYTKES